MPIQLSDKKLKYLRLYFDIAKRVAEMSQAERAQVGAVLVRDGRILSMGWNGMPAGWDNSCEHKLDDGSLKTNPEVLHAESNALMKIARSNESASGSTLYVTLSPCIECAKLIYQAGVKEVVYGECYHNYGGVQFLTRSGLQVIKHDEHSATTFLVRE